MNYEPFYERCRAMPEKDQKWAKAFCETLNGVFDDQGFLCKQKVCKLFYGKGNGLSKAQFYRKKKFVVELYKWFCEEGKVSQEFVDYVSGLKQEDVISETELNTYYFKDLNAMLSFIKEVGLFYGLNEENDLLVVRTIAVLTWYSVDVTEMVEIRKKDLNSDNRSILVRGVNKRTVIMSDNAFGVVKKFAITDSLRGFPAAKTQNCLPSQYLFRSMKQTKLNENNINCFLKRFNKEARQFGHELSLVALKKNGLFCNVLEKDNGEQTVNMIMKPMLPDRQMAFGYAKFYRVWKEKFYT